MSARDELIETLATYTKEYAATQDAYDNPEKYAAVEVDALVAEVRLATLREVRKAAIKIDRDPAQDPYYWGLSGREICKMLGAKVREARGEETS